MMDVNWSFESGSLLMAEVVGSDLLRVVPRRDYDHQGRNWTSIWCYFRLDGVAGRRICLEFLDLTDEWNYRTSFSWGPHTRPVYSVDHIRWQRFADVEYDAMHRSLRLWIQVPEDQLWIAYQPPYTLSQLRDFLSQLAPRPTMSISSLGTSAGGRPIPLVEVMAESLQAPRKHVWIVCRQHPWETASTFAAEGLLRLATSQTREARELLDRVALHVVPIANPDGVVLGHTRFNLHGYDLNRDYDRVTHTTRPETFYLQKRLQDGGQGADLVLNIHNNNQECSDLIAGFGEGLQHFAECLSRHTFFRGSVRESQREAFLADVTNNYILVEMRTGYDPILGRYVTAADQMAYGAGLARAIGEYCAR